MSERQASMHRKKTFTPSAVLLMSRLNREHIDILGETEMERVGEFNSQGHQKGYFPDILVKPRICVEIDGDAPRSAKSLRQDERKEMWLIEQGYLVLRFTNSQVTHHLDDVVRTIRKEMSRSG